MCYMQYFYKSTCEKVHINVINNTLFLEMEKLKQSVKSLLSFFLHTFITLKTLTVIH